MGVCVRSYDHFLTQRQIQIQEDNGLQDRAGFHNSDPFDPDPDT